MSVLFPTRQPLQWRRGSRRNHSVGHPERHPAPEQPAAQRHGPHWQPWQAFLVAEMSTNALFQIKLKHDFYALERQRPETKERCEIQDCNLKFITQF